MAIVRAETLKYLRYLNMAAGILLFKQMTLLWQTLYRLFFCIDSFLTTGGLEMNLGLKAPVCLR